MRCADDAVFDFAAKIRGQDEGNGFRVHTPHESHCLLALLPNPARARHTPFSCHTLPVPRFQLHLQHQAFHEILPSLLF
jgi:hypothetical protein